MILLICLGWLATDSFNLGLNKANSVSLARKGVRGYIMNVFFVGIIATFVFWAMNGFQLNVNSRVLVYSLIYGFLCILSVFVTPILYGCADIVEITIFDKASAVIFSSLLGVLLFSETFTLTSYLQIFLMVAATVCVLYSHPKEHKEAVKKKNSIKKYSLLILAALISTGSTVLSRYYVLDPNVTDNNSYFFLTNVVMALGAGIIMIVYSRKNGFNLKESFFVFEKRDYTNVVLRTVCSNCVALLSMAAVARLDMIIYTPVASAVSVVGSIIVAVIFKQKLNLFSYLALLFALISLSVVSFLPA